MGRKPDTPADQPAPTLARSGGSHIADELRGAVRVDGPTATPSAPSRRGFGSPTPPQAEATTEQPKETS